MIEMKGKFSTAKIMIDEVESDSVSQIQKILSHPACTNPVAIMPDTHLGKGIVIGFTCEMNGKIVPSWVGVDVNCSILALNLGKIENINMKELDDYIRKNVPLGMNIRQNSDIKAVNFERAFNWNKVNDDSLKFKRKYKEKFGIDIPLVKYDYDWFKEKCKNVGANYRKVELAIGTLGGGNHFISLEISSTKDIWLLIHSGSRNFGKCVCEYHENTGKRKIKEKREVDLKNKIDLILSDPSNLKDRPTLIKKAKEELELDFTIDIKNCEYLEGQDAINYLQDMIFVQEYANFNRITMGKIISEYFKITPLETIHSNHNFIDFDDWIIRKGATRSYVGEKLIIPLNMRDGSLICVGKSNPEWNFSAPHGAGRIYSRTKAKAEIKLEDFVDSMKGIFSTSISKDTLDESPFAYKDMNLIIESIEPTCEIIDRIIPIYNLKASEGEENIFSKKKKKGVGDEKINDIFLGDETLSGGTII